MGKLIDPMTKGQILGLVLHTDKSITDIAKEFHVSRHAVSDIKRLYEETGNVTPRPKSGRPPVSTEVGDRLLIREARKQPSLSVNGLASIWSLGSPSTISRRLRKAKLESRRAQVKCLLTQEHRKKRLEWAIFYSNFTFQDWASVHFSDESNFTLVNRKCRPFVRRLADEKFKPQFLAPKLQGGGGSIGVWGSMSWHGVDTCMVYKDKMEQWKYIWTLTDHVLPRLEEAKSKGENYLFQQDNAPCHTSFWSSCFFVEHDLKSMLWPARSPDLSPIEHIWADIDRELVKKPPQNHTELESEIIRHWNEYPRQKCINLIESMPKRISACIAAKGGHFKY